MYDYTLIKKAIEIHREVYGLNPSTISYAPGRIEVLGNHTDYNEGTVLSAAINMGHCFCISPSNKPNIRLTAGDVGKTVTVNPFTDERMDSPCEWANYIKGVIFFLRKEYEIEIDAVDCSFYGSIPIGAGLSSSAALEVSTAYAVLEYLNTSLDKKDIAKLSQKSEHIFTGCNCGLLDQISSIFGVSHGLIHSDFRTLDIAEVALPHNAIFLMINPHIQHALSESPYNARRMSCEKAASEFAAILDHPVKTLRDVSLDEFNRYKGKIDPEAAQRAEHVVGEITRVEEGILLLKENQLAEFGQLLYESHKTSRTAFENSCDELDIVVNVAREAGAYGARLSGGGWGGSVVALVEEKNADVIADKIMKICKLKELNPSIDKIIPSAGATCIKPDYGDC